MMISVISIVVFVHVLLVRSEFETEAYAKKFNSKIDWFIDCLIDWLTDWLLLNAQRAVFQLYSGWEQVLYKWGKCERILTVTSKVRSVG